MGQLISPPLKIAYLALVIAVVCIFRSPEVIGVMLLIQLGLWLSFSLGWHPLLRIMKRLVLFFLIIGLSYAFMSLGNSDQWVDLAIGQWKVPVNLGGLSVALVMCLRVLVLVMASAWVQESSKPGEFVRALEDFRMPRFLAASIDGTIRLASGGGQGRGGGGGGGGGGGHRDRQMSTKDAISLGFQEIRQGRTTFVTDMVERALGR